MKTSEYRKKALEVLKACGGNVSETCKALNLSRSQFYEWLNKNQKFRNSVNEIRETVKDNVESALYKNALEGNVVAQIFFLKTQCKDRGYVERVEMKHEGVVLPPWMKEDDGDKHEPQISQAGSTS